MDTAACHRAPARLSGRPPGAEPSSEDSLGFSVCTSCGFASDLHGPRRLCKHNTIKAQRRLEDSVSNGKGDVARQGTWGASRGLRDVAGPGREESGGGTVEDLHTEDFWVGGTPLSLPFVKRTTAAQRKNGVGEGSRRGHPPCPGSVPSQAVAAAFSLLKSFGLQRGTDA